MSKLNATQFNYTVEQYDINKGSSTYKTQILVKVYNLTT